MGLFSKDGGAGSAAGAEIERWSTLPLEELAVEVLQRGVAAYSPGYGEKGPNQHQIVATLLGGEQRGDLGDRAAGLVAEACQLLEHARLIRMEAASGEGAPLQFVLNRAGAAAIAAGDVRTRLGV